MKLITHNINLYCFFFFSKANIWIAKSNKGFLTLLITYNINLSQYNFSIANIWIPKSNKGALTLKVLKLILSTVEKTTGN